MEARREVEEWILRLELGPKTRFVFVEGVNDQRTISMLGLGATEVRTIADVELSLLDEISPYLSGNRGRLVEFAGQLALAGILNAKILVDNDMGPLDPSPPFPANCIRTDFADLPAGFIDRPSLQLALAKGIATEMSDEEWSTLVAGLRYLFACRKFRYDLYPNLTPPAPEAIISCLGQKVALALGEYLRRVKAAGVNEKLEDLAATVEEIAGDLEDLDFRTYLHCHDFIELLYRILRCSRKLKSSFRTEHLWAIVMAGVQLTAVDLPRLNSLLEWAREG